MCTSPAPRSDPATRRRVDVCDVGATSLTLAGFVALGALALTAIGMAMSTATRQQQHGEQIAKLEALLNDKPDAR